MTKASQLDTAKMKELQEKLKRSSEEIFQDGPDCDEPQATGNPH